LIEVNLIPSGKKRASRGPKRPIRIPSLEALPKDRWVLGSGAVVVVLAAVAALLFLTTASRRSELTVLLEEAAADSARYADLIQQSQRMTARRDSIAQRVAIIQELDGDRYTWPHILDEVARALPDYTWLTDLLQVAGGAQPQFRIVGRAGNNFAVTQFMENLEASLFIRSVQLISTEQVVDQERIVNQFTLEAIFERPPAELLETVPLFGADSAATTGPAGS
jgi:Tfp pilus assembly protein PilN